MAKKPWRKILYEEQDYPDNYVDGSFLDEMRKNVYTRTYHFWSVSSAAGMVSQQVSSLCIFVMGFVYMKEDVISPATLFVVSAIVTTLSYIVHVMTSWDERFKNSRGRIRDDVKSLILFLAFSYGLSPILRTLTDSISTDTVYAMTVSMLGMNLLMHDYGASGAIVSKAVSLNTAIFGSVCLASRLPSSWHTFVTVILAVQIFALFPLFREQIKVFFPGSQFVMTWSLLCVALTSVSIVSFLGGVFFILAQVAVIFLCPYWLVSLQRYKKSDAEEYGFDPNVWDIGLTIPMEKMMSIRLDDTWRVPEETTLREYRQFVPLEHRRNAGLGFGGTLSLVTEGDAIRKVKVYNRIVHVLNGCHGYNLAAVQGTEQARKQIGHIREIATKLARHPQHIGGVRIEATIESTTLEEAIQVYEQRLPNVLSEFLHPVQVNYVCMSTDNYLQRVQAILERGLGILRGRGVFSWRENRPLAIEEKRIINDLKSLIGYTVEGRHTSPLNPNAWWKEPNDGIPPPPPPPPPPLAPQQQQGESRPPPEHTNARLFTMCRDQKVANNRTRIEWAGILRTFRAKFPGVDSSDEQIKNRYKNLVRRGYQA